MKKIRRPIIFRPETDSVSLQASNKFTLECIQSAPPEVRIGIRSPLNVELHTYCSYHCYHFTNSEGSNKKLGHGAGAKCGSVSLMDRCS